MATNQPDRPQREQWATKQDASRTDFGPAPRPLRYQLAAWALWLVALAVELGGSLVVAGAVSIPVLSALGALPALTVALMLVVGLVLVLFAQRMWKKAGAVSGKKQGLLGVAMACLSFAPMCLFFLTAKNASGATKGAAVAASVAAVALALALCWLLPGDPYAAYFVVTGTSPVPTPTAGA